MEIRHVFLRQKSVFRRLSKRKLQKKKYYFQDAHTSHLTSETVQTTGVLEPNPVQAHCTEIRPENSFQF